MRRSRCATAPGHPRVKAKLVGVKVQSNYNNVGANRLRVVEDTTDEAGCRPQPVRRDVADADRTLFVGDAADGTNEVADVSVIEAIDQVWSGPCTPGCVLTAINVKLERLSTNCRVGPKRQRTLPGKSLLSVLEPSAVILNFGSESPYFFNCFSGTKPMTLAPNDRTSSCEARGLQRFAHGPALCRLR